MVITAHLQEVSQLDSEAEKHGDIKEKKNESCRSRMESCRLLIMPLYICVVL